MGRSGWGLRFACVCFLAFLISPPSARAEMPGLSHWLAPFLLGEIGLPPSAEIKNQTDSPYCGLYAMTSFMEIWAKSKSRARWANVPSLDPAYLAVAYNLSVGSGISGSFPEELLYIIQKYGVVPRHVTALLSGNAQDVRAGWKGAHRNLIDAAVARELLNATYGHPDVAPEFTGKQFLDEQLRIDFRRFELVNSAYRETYKSSAGSTTEPEYRVKDSSARWGGIKTGLKEMGIDPERRELEADALYRALVAQLTRRRPAYIAVNVDLVAGPFGNRRVVATQDLLPLGEAINSSHALVAMGLCDGREPIAAACAPFRREMEDVGVSECVIVQNSWGEEVHAKGYACLSRNSLRRMLHAAMLQKPREGARAAK